MKKIISAFLAVILILPLLSCSKDKGNINKSPLFTYKDTTITYGMFSYALAYAKTSYLVMCDTLEDSEAIWAQKHSPNSNQTVGEALLIDTINLVKKYLCLAGEAKAAGITLSESDLDSLDKNIDSIIDIYGTKAEFEEAMSKIGIDEEDLRDYLTIQYLAIKESSSLFGDSGQEPVTATDVAAYYCNNYLTVKHIYINNVYKTDENGEYIYLTEEEADAKNDKINRIFTALEDGENIEDYLSEGEDDFQANFPNGMTLSRDTKSKYDEYSKIITDITPHSFAKAETADGVYIIYCTDLNTKAIDEFYTDVQDSVVSERLEMFLKDKKDEIKTDDDLLLDFSAAKAAVLNLGKIAKETNEAVTESGEQ